MAKAYGIHNGRFSSRCTIYIGKDGKIAYVDKKVKARSHGEDIVKKLKELGVEAKK